MLSFLKRKAPEQVDEPGSPVVILTKTEPDTEAPALGSCIRHHDTVGTGLCTDCERPFCDACLVRPAHGRRAKVRCIGCALRFSGVRPGPTPRRTA